jgi:hypothetical protein
LSLQTKKVREHELLQGYRRCQGRRIATDPTFAQKLQSGLQRTTDCSDSGRTGNITFLTSLPCHVRRPCRDHGPDPHPGQPAAQLQELGQEQPQQLPMRLVQEAAQLREGQRLTWKQFNDTSLPYE